MKVAVISLMFVAASMVLANGWECYQASDTGTYSAILLNRADQDSRVPASLAVLKRGTLIALRLDSDVDVDTVKGTFPGPKVERNKLYSSGKGWRAWENLPKESRRIELLVNANQDSPSDSLDAGQRRAGKLRFGPKDEPTKEITMACYYLLTNEKQRATAHKVQQDERQQKQQLQQLQQQQSKQEQEQEQQEEQKQQQQQKPKKS